MTTSQQQQNNGKTKENVPHQVSQPLKKAKTEDNRDDYLSHRLTRARMDRARATSLCELQTLQAELESILAVSKKESQVWIDAGMFLATLLLQDPDEYDNNDAQQQSSARLLLSERGFPYRLSRDALRQSHDVPVSAPLVLPFANAWDNVLPPVLFHQLLLAFDTESSFWSFHNYSDGSSQGRPPSPYFSYVLPLKEDEIQHQQQNKESSVIRQVVEILKQHVATIFPAVQNCNAVEWWCHCRPHASGHQLHFDSDDEGRGGVRNPLCSTVLTLTDGGFGGETMLTTQSAASQRMTQDGWLVQGKRNRLLAFRGNLLHGVVPGSGVVLDDATSLSSSTRRRITFMVAFWKRICVQNDAGHGAARPFARVVNQPWARPLLQTCSSNLTTPEVAQDCFFRVPVWEDVDEQENERQNVSLRQVKKSRVLPPYDSFFQFYT